MPRYHFDEFVLSPRQRLLLRGGAEQPLIPRYFDLLVFLVERRHEAVHRQDIFERVWSDAVVSDSALSQAIRTIRRVLDDDPKEPRFIRTVSRHGYRFVFPDVREEEDVDVEAGTNGGAATLPVAADVTALRAAPIEEQPAVRAPVAQRAAGWAEAAAGGAGAGLVAGMLGGLLLALAPDGTASFAVVPALALIGAGCGAVGGAGVGAGLSAAGARRSSQRWRLALGALIGGAAVGTAAQWLGRWSLAALVGVRLDIGGTLEGIVIGAAAGIGYAAATGPTDEAPRLRVAVLMAVCCGLAALLLTSLGRPLVGGTIHAIATGLDGSQAALTPLGRLLNEPDFGPLSSAIIGTFEGLLFGAGVGFAFSRRP